MDKNDWEKRFQALAAAGPEAPTRPDRLVQEIAGGWPTLQIRRALDLACGAGPNALWLAGHGWDVTAVDRSPSAIGLVRAQSAQRGVPVTTHVADLEAHEFEIAPDAWDFILMCRYLQRDLFEPAKLGLKSGGVLIVIALLAGAATGRFRVQPGELAEYFGGSAEWKILHRREGMAREHRVAEIAVRREV